MSPTEFYELINALRETLHVHPKLKMTDIFARLAACETDRQAVDKMKEILKTGEV